MTKVELMMVEVEQVIGKGLMIKTVSLWNLQPPVLARLHQRQLIDSIQQGLDVLDAGLWVWKRLAVFEVSVDMRLRQKLNQRWTLQILHVDVLLMTFYQPVF